MPSSTRSTRLEDAAVARDLQMQAGLHAAARGVAIGVGLNILLHYTWPTFRRQTLPFKAFLVSGCSLAGLVFGAEAALLDYEATRRHEENKIRNMARLELGRQGIIPTETAISQWRDAREATAFSEEHEPPQKTMSNH